MPRLPLNFALACLLACMAAAPAALAGPPDPSVKALLDAEGLSYEVDKDGDYQVIFDVGNERSQLVWIRSAVERYGSLRVREIWSAGFKHAGKPLSAAQANRLLEHAHSLILGGWTRQKEFAMFVVKVPADATQQQLRDGAEAAANGADQIEKEFTPGKDDL
jgi:hypothetical protein